MDDVNEETNIIESNAEKDKYSLYFFHSCFT